MGSLGIYCSIISFFGIFKVSIDPSSSKMKLIGLFSNRGGIEISINNIKEYYKTKTLGRWRYFNGLLIKLEDGSVFELTEFKLVSIDAIESFLIESKTLCLGETKSRNPFKAKF